VGDRGIEPAQVLGCHPSGGASCQESLQGSANLLDLQRLAVVDQPDACAAVRLQDDQPLLVEPDERSANGSAPRTDQLRDRGLDQPLVRLEPATDDRLAQCVVDVLRDPGLVVAGSQIIVNNVDNCRPWRRKEGKT
jgi:hypothetical protein